ncbi:class A beta-lactamase [Pacificimonas sp. WHA3]|uniref:beta-lactamase n=1 Tax=Pacificimonas pallii TaxID=2827236 RepID=A0ABS6SAS4_9SPHN|nr:class A beta-lactamase [Pacificimonas pallii]MBV7255439.1 class A beta-lactamase [Pacificimonas pallii]
MAVHLPTRRHIAGAIALFPFVAACAVQTGSATGTADDPARRFVDLEARAGGRIGVAALDLEGSATIAHRGAERFAMCSTFKWLLGAFVLQRVEHGAEALDRVIMVEADDLVFHSPVTKPRAGQGMRVDELVSATIQTSDNTAANLLLKDLGGPAGFTAMARDAGDAITRLDRLEPALNENVPGDPRDTSTPDAMVKIMAHMLFGGGLGAPSQAILQDWMVGAKTGLNRLRAGLPPTWISGDKTGTSDRNQSNDVAFAIPPAGSTRGPVLLVSYLNVPNPMGVDDVHADIAAIVTDHFGMA